ncbi:MAG: hypothetical protein JOZ71_03395 [Ktedonobacteraceae bacterium]|nr:hypothetical protein [Ktedonobacteraceae bacterium]
MRHASIPAMIRSSSGTAASRAFPAIARQDRYWGVIDAAKDLQRHAKLEKRSTVERKRQVFG